MSLALCVVFASTTLGLPCAVVCAVSESHSEHDADSDADHCPPSLCTQDPLPAVSADAGDVSPPSQVSIPVLVPDAHWSPAGAWTGRIEPATTSHSPPIPPAFSILRP